VLAGLPNVGKSSLLNSLVGSDLAIVSPIPGTTRDSVRETIDLEGVRLEIVDTAGLRETNDVVESLGIERSWREFGEADVIVLVCDARTGLTKETRQILAQAPPRLARIVVFNKIDIERIAASTGQADGFSEVWLSAKTTEGLQGLRDALLRVAGMEVLEEDVFLARERHVSALLAAQTSLQAAEGQFPRPELFAEELRRAHTQLESITGKFSADALLGEIFARFCIGK
jgi:tRNA modification GTPase